MKIFLAIIFVCIKGVSFSDHEMMPATAQLHMMRDVESRIDDLMNRITESHRAVEIAKEKVDVINTRLREREMEHELLLAKLDHLHRQAGHRRRFLDESEGDLDHLEKSIGNVTESLKELNETTSLLQTSIQALEKEKVDLANRLKELSPKEIPPTMPSYQTVQEAIETVRFPSIRCRKAEPPELLEWLGPKTQTLAKGPEIAFLLEVDEEPLPVITLFIKNILLKDLIKEICVQCDLAVRIEEHAIVFTRK